jgi:nucleotide-binding universal stress UspA family protein
MSVIVVGVDGSPTAAQAASTAARLASTLGSRLLVVSAFSTTAADRTDVTDDDGFTVRDTAEKLAHDAAESLRGTHPDLDVSSDAEPGKAAEALVRAAEAAKAELIVIGNKRAQGMTRVLGSVAVDVVRKAPCDVYIAHTHG